VIGYDAGQKKEAQEKKHLHRKIIPMRNKEIEKKSEKKSACMMT
jgi:hypothetical protein